MPVRANYRPPVGPEARPHSCWNAALTTTHSPRHEGAGTTDVRASVPGPTGITESHRATECTEESEQRSERLRAACPCGGANMQVGPHHVEEWSRRSRTRAAHRLVHSGPGPRACGHWCIWVCNPQTACVLHVGPMGRSEEVGPMAAFLPAAQQHGGSCADLELGYVTAACPWCVTRPRRTRRLMQPVGVLVTSGGCRGWEDMCGNRMRRTSGAM